MTRTPGIRRYIFNTVTVVSLLLMLASVTLWIGSYLVTRIPVASITIWESPSWVLYLSSDLDEGDVSLSTSIYPGDTSRFYSPQMPSFGYFAGFDYSAGRGLGRHRYVTITTPYWFLALIFTTLPAIWLFKWNRRRKLGPNACLSCGYDLTSNESGACPECGAQLKAPDASGFHSV